MLKPLDLFATTTQIGVVKVMSRLVRPEIATTTLTPLELIATTTLINVVTASGECCLAATSSTSLDLLSTLQGLNTQQWKPRIAILYVCEIYQQRQKWNTS